MADWEEHVRQWSHPPVDDVGYFSSQDMMEMPDHDLKQVMEGMRRTRYGGWRNYGNKWRSQLKLDDTHDKDVLDFGCGNGLESLEYAIQGNRVRIADISEWNLKLAARVMMLSGKEPESIHLVGNEPPFLRLPKESLDVFHCNGVLHHIRWPKEVLKEAEQLLRPGGEVRLMVYSDEGWRQATGTEPPQDTESHPLFEKFVRHFDAVGEYADWYDRQKLEAMCGSLTVETVEHITHDNRYMVAVLKKKG